MSPGARKKIVVLGMLTRMPVAGCAWLTMHYMVGLRRLGHDVCYVEAHAMTPSMLIQDPGDDGSLRAAEFLSTVMKRFDFGHSWALHALHADGRCFGMSELQLRELYRDADMIINLHGATVTRPEHRETGRLVYLETDPVELQIKLHDGDEDAFAFLEPHASFFSWGANYGAADCQVPQPAAFHFRPTRPPVVLDFWRNSRGNDARGSAFTTVGSWRQAADVTFRDEVYHWSKHYEYLKFLDLPRRRPGQEFELALSQYEPSDETLLREQGWKVRPASSVSTDLDLYRDYIRNSRGEFTVAKDQNVRLRSGWFSDRSVEYLAAGRPVITQETGFSNTLPTGKGLFGFSTMEDILAAVDCINSDYEGNCRAAADIARAYFSHDVVLPRLLDESGLS